MRLKHLKRWLILGHRWLGIMTGLFLAAWVLSGLVMLYVAFPALTEAERLSHLRPIAWDRVRLGPDAALARAGLDPAPGGLSLSMRGADAVYQVATRDGARHAVSAETGYVLGDIDAAAALKSFGPGATLRAVTRDQWTVRDRYDSLRPFHVVAPGDAAGTELYVSARTGLVALDTTRRSACGTGSGRSRTGSTRRPAGAGRPLARGRALGLGCRRGRRPERLGHRDLAPAPASALRGRRGDALSGLARWHHLFGLVGGLSLVSFVASGWLSMNPNHWFSPRTPPAEMRAAYAGAPAR